MEGLWEGGRDTRSRQGKQTFWSSFQALSLASTQAIREFSLTNQITRNHMNLTNDRNTRLHVRT